MCYKDVSCIIVCNEDIDRSTIGVERIKIRKNL